MNWKWPKKILAWKEVLGRYQYVLLVIAAGLLLLLLPTGEKAAPTQQPEGQLAFDLEGFERRLEDVLSQVEGAGATRVVLTLKSEGRRILAQDTQRGSNGDVKADIVTVGRGSGIQEVIAVETFSPQFQGALVVCAGGESPQVQLRLITAVSALTGLGADKISICKGN